MVTGFVQSVGGTVEAVLASVKVFGRAHHDVKQLFGVDWKLTSSSRNISTPWVDHHVLLFKNLWSKVPVHLEKHLAAMAADRSEFLMVVLVALMRSPQRWQSNSVLIWSRVSSNLAGLPSQVLKLSLVCWTT